MIQFKQQLIDLHLNILRNFFKSIGYTEYEETDNSFFGEESFKIRYRKVKASKYYIIDKFQFNNGPAVRIYEYEPRNYFGGLTTKISSAQNIDNFFKTVNDITF